MSTWEAGKDKEALWLETFAVGLIMEVCELLFPLLRACKLLPSSVCKLASCSASVRLACPALRLGPPSITQKPVGTNNGLSGILLVIC